MKKLTEKLAVNEIIYVLNIAKNLKYDIEFDKKLEELNQTYMNLCFRFIESINNNYTLKEIENIADKLKTLKSYLFYIKLINLN